MYCSSCGVAVAQGRSYCNHCGAKLNTGKDDSVGKSADVKPELLVSAMSALFIFGLVAIIMMMGMMKAVMEIPVERVLHIALLPFLLLLLLEGVFMKLLLRRKRGAEEAGDTVQLKGQATRELDAAHARALPEPIPSVTEHTTRAFAPISSERTSK